MTTRKKWLLITLFSLAGMVLCILMARPREPRYQDRPLREWLADLSHSHYETQRLARLAIKQMGPEAVPFLTNSLAQRNALSIRIYRKDIIPRKLVKWAQRVVKWHTPQMESRNAALALHAIGPAADDAVPSLMAAIQDPSFTVAHSASVALGSMGTNAVPALDARLTIATPTEMTWILQAIIGLGTNATPLIPKLAPLLESHDSGISGNAAMALTRIGPPSIPAITNFLSSTNKSARIRALMILSQVGPAAGTNSLLPLIQHPDPDVRQVASNALATVRARQIK